MSPCSAVGYTIPYYQAGQKGPCFGKTTSTTPAAKLKSRRSLRQWLYDLRYEPVLLPFFIILAISGELELAADAGLIHLCNLHSADAQPPCEVNCRACCCCSCGLWSHCLALDLRSSNDCKDSDAEEGAVRHLVWAQRLLMIMCDSAWHIR